MFLPACLLACLPSFFSLPLFLPVCPTVHVLSVCPRRSVGWSVDDLLAHPPLCPCAFVPAVLSTSPCLTPGFSPSTKLLTRITIASIAPNVAVTFLLFPPELALNALPPLRVV